ncbi:MAG: hypothetical protein ABI874_09050, partial [Chloroflexota bacterium]
GDRGEGERGIRGRAIKKWGEGDDSPSPVSISFLHTSRILSLSKDAIKVVERTVRQAHHARPHS